MTVTEHPSIAGGQPRSGETRSLDGLTGVYLRGPGHVELVREMAKARRTKEPLVLAFVDVDGLKSINDSHGHAAGDRVLLDVADALKATLRAYDVIIRHGGDEFVCVIQGLTIAETEKRLSQVNRALAHGPEHGSVTIGVTQVKPDDSPEDLVARADAALYQKRQRQQD